MTYEEAAEVLTHPMLRALILKGVNEGMLSAYQNVLRLKSLSLEDAETIDKIIIKTQQGIANADAEYQAALEEIDYE